MRQERDQIDEAGGSRCLAGGESEMRMKRDNGINMCIGKLRDLKHCDDQEIPNRMYDKL